MLDYQAIIKSDTATRLLNVFTFEYNSDVGLCQDEISQIVRLHILGNSEENFYR